MSSLVFHQDRKGTGYTVLIQKGFLSLEMFLSMKIFFPFKTNSEISDQGTTPLPVIIDISDDVFDSAEFTEEEPVVNNDHGLQNEDTEIQRGTQASRISTRTKRTPRWLEDVVVNNCHAKANCDSYKPNKKSGKYISYDIGTFPYKIASCLKPEYVNFFTNLSDGQ